MQFHKGVLKFTWENKCPQWAKAIEKNTHKRSQGKCTLTAIKLAEAIAIKTIRNWYRQTDQIESRNKYDLCRGIITNKCENNRMFNKLFGEI